MDQASLNHGLTEPGLMTKPSRSSPPLEPPAPTQPATQLRRSWRCANPWFQEARQRPGPLRASTAVGFQRAAVPLAWFRFGPSLPQ